MLVKILIAFCLTLVATAYAKETRIIKGIYAEQSDFWFHATLRSIVDDYPLCGGAIITKNHILSAAHCVFDPIEAFSDLKIIIGTSNSTSDPGIQLFPKYIIVHPKFKLNVNSLSARQNDVAVIKVEEEISFKGFQGPLNLPDQDTRHIEVGILSGWGLTNYPELRKSTILRKIWLNIIESKICSMMMPYKLKRDQFCGYQKQGVGACTGDGGSPLVNDNKVIGILSIIRPCAMGFPDVFTDVYSHLDFIKKAIKFRE